LDFNPKFLDDATRAALLDRYARSAKRLLLLDYDGTLTPFSKHPSMALPGNDTLDILGQISANAQNDVYIISGRDSATLEKWFGHLPVGLVAEHGAKIRHKAGHWETDAIVKRKAWKPEVTKLMEDYVATCPQSFIEEKEYSLAWHYRNADTAQGISEAKKLYENLLACTAPLSLHVLNGNKVIEVRIKGIDKGMAVEKILGNAGYDFILSVGDDITDEDMFKKLAALPEAFTIRIGAEASHARYHLPAPYMVQSLLQAIASVN
jgi:trehalose 6-phosphate synthase/phosphatase